MRGISYLLVVMMLMICVFTVTAYAETSNVEISRSEYLKTELIGTWEDFLSVTEVAILEDGKCYLIDPYGDAKECKYLLAEDIAADDVEYFKRVIDESEYIELEDGSKVDYIDYFGSVYSLKGPDIAIYDIDVSEVKGNEFAVVMLGYYVEGTHPNNFTQEDFMKVYYVDYDSGYERMRAADLARTEKEEEMSEIYSSAENEDDNWDETGYIGDWASYEYSAVLRLEESGIYHYSALGNLNSGIAGMYKVYDDLNDIPAEFSRQIHHNYSASNVKWIVLLDVVGNVYEFGYYDVNTDELWMPDLFTRE